MRAASSEAKPKGGGFTLRKAALVGCVLAGLVFGGSAQAANWKVLVGEQAKPPAGTPKGTTLNQFFPGRIEVNAGDKVAFQSSGFHTVAYLGGKQQSDAPFMPDPGKALYANIVDSAGQPFYFNSLPKFVFNPAVLAPMGPKVIADAKTVASSGVIAPGPNGKPVTATYTFAKPGGYSILCTVHPGMKMTVSVKPQGAPVQAAADVARRSKAETAVAWAKSKPLAAAKTPAGTVFAGVGGKTTILGFFPKELRVKAGTTVSFVEQVAERAAQHRLRAGEVHGAVQQGERVPADRPDRAEPGRAGLHLRDGAAWQVHLRRQEPRKRLPGDTADGHASRRARALREGDVHGPGEVPLHLLPPRA